MSKVYTWDQLFSRRSFIKGAVGTAALGAAAGTGLLMPNGSLGADNSAKETIEDVKIQQTQGRAIESGWESCQLRRNCGGPGVVGRDVFALISPGFIFGNRADLKPVTHRFQYFIVNGFQTHSFICPGKCHFLLPW